MWAPQDVLTLSHRSHQGRLDLSGRLLLSADNHGSKQTQHETERWIAERTDGAVQGFVLPAPSAHHCAWLPKLPDDQSSHVLGEHTHTCDEDHLLNKRLAFSEHIMSSPCCPTALRMTRAKGTRRPQREVPATTAASGASGHPPAATVHQHSFRQLKVRVWSCCCNERQRHQSLATYSKHVGNGSC